MDTIKKFLLDLNKMWTPISDKDIKWVPSSHDDNFFDECVKQLNSLNIYSVLDVACGGGHFIKKCIHNGIDAFGIEPRGEGFEAFERYPLAELRTQGRIVYGTFETFIAFFKNIWPQRYSTVKFDCITVHNTIHGISDPDMIIDLFRIFKTKAKYIVISEPIWDRWNEEEQKYIKEKINIDKNFKKIHSFKKAYGFNIFNDGVERTDYTIHNLYEVI